MFLDGNIKWSHFQATFIGENIGSVHLFQTKYKYNFPQIIL